MPYCQSCGTFGETAFCTKCGQRLTAPVPPPEGATPQQPAQPPAVQPPAPTEPAPASPPPPQQPTVQPVPAYTEFVEPSMPAITEPVPQQQPAAQPAPTPPSPAPVQAAGPEPVAAEGATPTVGQDPAYQAPPAQYGQPPSQYPAAAPPPAYGDTYGQPQKVASAYYLAIVALILAFLGGILGMVLALLAGWLAKKQAAQGLAKTAQATTIANLAFLIATVVFLIVMWSW